jgi:hypothetical protein
MFRQNIISTITKPIGVISAGAEQQQSASLYFDWLVDSKVPQVGKSNLK